MTLARGRAENDADLGVSTTLSAGGGSLADHDQGPVLPSRGAAGAHLTEPAMGANEAAASGGQAQATQSRNRASSRSRWRCLRYRCCRYRRRAPHVGGPEVRERAAGDDHVIGQSGAAREAGERDEVDPVGRVVGQRLAVRREGHAYRPEGVRMGLRPRRDVNHPGNEVTHAAWTVGVAREVGSRRPACSSKNREAPVIRSSSRRLEWRSKARR